MQTIRGTLAALTVAVVGSFLWASTAQAQDIRIQAGGATFPAPIYLRWVAEYHKLHANIRVDYQSIGSGGGIKGITDKTFDLAGSDAPLNKGEMEKLGGPEKVIQIPSVAGAVVMAYNIPGFKGDLKLDGPIIAGIYMGTIKNWNDGKIAALNPDAKLPDLAITATHRSDGSGTTYIFTNYVATQNEAFRDKVGTGKQVEWPGGQGGPGNEGVAAIVKQTNGAIGYIELTYALQNNIPFALLKNKDGNFVKATPEAVAEAGHGAVELMNKEKRLDVPLWDQPGAKAYPIAGFTYLILYRDLSYLKSKDKAQAMVNYLAWATHPEGQKIAMELSYAPLSQGIQDKVADALSKATFDGAALKASAN